MSDEHRRETDSNLVKKAAESSILLLLARCSSVVLTSITAWLLHSVQTMEVAGAVISSKVDALAAQVGQLQEFVFKIPH